ncbi:hypothetical protein BJ741DRAFT_659468 [Chytriomyces cf. hyalinus JEL632]|nr:hypothetical protein BJ741DRAFT_659468 [Chytriomyces cf. hyalinus JEL632]
MEDVDMVDAAFSPSTKNSLPVSPTLDVVMVENNALHNSESTKADAVATEDVDIVDAASQPVSPTLYVGVGEIVAQGASGIMPSPSHGSETPRTQILTTPSTVASTGAQFNGRGSRSRLEVKPKTHGKKPYRMSDFSAPKRRISKPEMLKVTTVKTSVDTNPSVSTASPQVPSRSQSPSHMPVQLPIISATPTSAQKDSPTSVPSSPQVPATSRPDFGQASSLKTETTAREQSPSPQEESKVSNQFYGPYLETTRSAAWHKPRYNKPIEPRTHENARNADNDYDYDYDAVDPPAPSPFTWSATVTESWTAGPSLAAPAPAPTPTKGPASAKGPEPEKEPAQTQTPAPVPVPDSALCFTHFHLTLEDPSAWVEFNNSHYLETLKYQVAMNPSVGPGLFCERIMNLQSLDSDECVTMHKIDLFNM